VGREIEVSQEWSLGGLPLGLTGLASTTTHPRPIKNRPTT
jgi:hypothetical protein